MKKRVLALVCLAAMVSALSGCGCAHQWEEATCLAPKTCILCNATEGEALGHRWQEATCTAPQACSLCHATQGEALEHTEGDWEITETDPVKAIIYSEKRCTTCDVLLDKKNEELEQLHQDGWFLLSGNQFVQRLNDQLANCGRSDLKAVAADASNQFICWLYEDTHLVGYIQLYISKSEVIQPNHGDDTPFLLTLGFISGSNTSTFVPALLMALDPTFKTQDSALLTSIDIVNNPGQLYEKNGISYMVTGFSYGGNEQGLYYDSGIVMVAMLDSE